MNVPARVKELASNRGWTEYRLVKESGLAASTIANIYHRNTVPSVPTIEILCKAFGITLSQFFSTDDVISLSEEQTVLLKAWSSISEEQRASVLQLLNSMTNK